MYLLLSHLIFRVLRMWAVQSPDCFAMTLKPTKILVGSLFFFEDLLISSLKYTPALQFRSVAQSCPTLCDPMDGSMPGFPTLREYFLLLLGNVLLLLGNIFLPNRLLDTGSYLPLEFHFCWFI